MKKITFLAIATVLMSVHAWAQSYIYFHTNQTVGNTISLGIIADTIDQPNVWIDLNGNQSKDDGEEVTNFSFWLTTPYTIASQDIRVYGNVKKINCNYNSIDSLNLSQNVNLTDLNCNSNQLQNLDVSKNVNLIKFYCDSNPLQSLDLSKSVSLTSLSCNNNQLQSLNVSQNMNLTSLSCCKNQLQSLNVSQNMNLTTLECYENQLTGLDVSQDVALTYLDCNSNQLLSLDVSQNVNLTYLDCGNNALTNLNIANDNNDNIEEMYAGENPALTCIQVDDDFDVSTATEWAKDDIAQWNNDAANPCGSAAVTSLSITPNEVTMGIGGTKQLGAIVEPFNANTAVTWSSSNETIATVDANGLVTALAGGAAIVTATSAGGSKTADCAITVIDPNAIRIYFHTNKTVGDTIILGIEAGAADQPNIWIDLNGDQTKQPGEEVTHFDLYSKTPYTIASQEIRVYGNVKQFNCGNNQIDSLNPSQNVNLTYLDCNSNQLQNLDISKNVNLIDLYCYKNQLTGLDISKNVNLIRFDCNNNQLTNLDLSQNVKLARLWCHFNQLQNLDVSKNVNLIDLHCYKNQLTGLDLSKNVNLIRFDCNNNQLTNLDLSQNVKLEILWCHFNQLQILDVSQNPALTYLDCKNNTLTALNIANSNDTNLTVMNATKNPDLTCIQVDDGFDVSATSWTKDPFAQWNNDAANPCGSAAVTSISVTPNEATMGIDDTKQLDVTVEPFNANTAVSWSCSDNNIATVDANGLVTAVAKGTATVTATTADGSKTADCTITVIDPNDIQIYFHTNQTIGNTISLGIVADAADQAAVWIDLNGNQSKDSAEEVTHFDWTTADYTIASQDIRVYGNVKEFNCNSSQIDSLNPSQNVNLTKLYCQYNQLQSLDVSKNVALTILGCQDNQLQSLDVSQNVDLKDLRCYSNQLQSLDLSKNKALTQLYCYQNQLQSLDVSQNVDLKDLRCYSNQLQSLDLSKNKALTQLYCYSNQLQSLDVSQNVDLTTLYCYQNQLQSLDLSKNVALTQLYCNSNQLQSLNVSQNVTLTQLYCNSNQLQSLDLSQNTDLTMFECHENQLQSLDVSQNVTLTWLDCKNNALTALNIANGNNANLTTMDATGNPALTCMQIDDGFTASTSWAKDDTAEWNNDAANPCDWLNGVEELGRKQDVSIYPNPATQSINVEVPEQMIGATINIYDQVGRILMCRKINAELNVLDISNLPKGIYLIKTGTSTSKLVKN